MDSNATSTAGTAPNPSNPNLQHGFNLAVGLPLTLLDALIPGYSVLANFFLTSFGIDVSFYVSLVALAFVASTALRVIINPIIDLFLSSFVSSVVIEQYDAIWDEVLRWCGSHKALQNLRSLRGSSQSQYYDDDDDENGVENGDENDMIRIHSGIPDDAIFNFRDWAARAPPRFEPHSSSGLFWHKGYLFRISRETQRVSEGWSDTVSDREKLIIMVIWRSTKPIKSLIEEARELSLSKKSCTTTIRRPTSKAERGRRNAWTTVARRPSRPMATVVLDNEQKLAILEDVNEFLHPKTSKWYSNRGIPYRRGYLFHGAPGTGKSSLSFALAGLFGLDIYCLSLSEVTLTEEDMIMLFNSLPKRCVVLLEDIDCAGISRPKPQKTTSKKSSKKKARKSRGVSTTTDTSDDAVVLGSQPKKLTNAITISGLLNAIDGVASAEGRVLIMTTNYPDKLDDALVRPGRVDLRIEFKLSSRSQIRELFMRMYCADEKGVSEQPKKITQVLPRLELSSVAAGKEVPKDVADVKDSGRTLESLADQFANALPEEKFSPAEIQGFLLMRKRSPLKAVQDVAAWVGEQLEKQQTREDKRRFKDTGNENVEAGPGIAGSESDASDDEGSSSSND